MELFDALHESAVVTAFGRWVQDVSTRAETGGRRSKAAKEQVVERLHEILGASSPARQLGEASPAMMVRISLLLHSWKVSVLVQKGLSFVLSTGGRSWRLTRSPSRHRRVERKKMMALAEAREIDATMWWPVRRAKARRSRSWRSQDWSSVLTRQ